VGALVLDLFDPLAMGRLESIIGEIFVRGFVFTLVETMALQMPLVTSSEACIVERG
jgi:hypothetical protein